METLIPLLVPMGIFDSIGGFFTTLMTPLHWAVSGLLVLFHWLYSPLLGTDSGATWVLAIVSLTIVVRACTIPLFVKQIQSSRNMQMIQPKVRELQKKYGHDRERLGQETMKLYREENANPMASCLPMLLMMPVFFALFQVLSGAARGQAHGAWLEDRPDLVESLRAATIFGARISDQMWPFSGINNVFIVTVVLILAMTGTMFYTQLQLMRKNMPPEALTGPMAQQQKMMLYIFPVIFAVGGVNFPVGVLIYWLTSNLWTAGQQYYIIKRNPAPGTEAYKEWEAKRKAKGLPVGGAPAVVAATDGDPGTGPTDVTKIQRQQPRKQTRSQRNKK